jgi:nucleotide-binding universal stress UspA family protein
MAPPARIYHRVLVPLDGSTTAEFALRFAADLAVRHQADLLLLHLAYIPAVEPAANNDEAPANDSIRDYLAGLRRELEADDVRVREHVLESRDLKAALLQFVDAERVSVIVMSTQGRTGMIRWLFGSSADAALSSLPVPILLVRPVYQQIVVPLDGSAWSESAIPRASELARVHDAELILLHVYQPSSGNYAPQWALAGQQQIADQAFDQIHEHLTALRNQLRREGLRARDVIIRSNNPAQAICDYVTSEDGMAMIVMSTHGRTGLSRWLLGSVAQNVVRSARVPVTLVRAEG